MNEKLNEAIQSLGDTKKDVVVMGVIETLTTETLTGS